MGEETSRAATGPAALILAAIVCCLIGSGRAGAADEAGVLEAAGVRAGVCVHVLSGDPRTSVELGRDGRMIVHVLAGAEAATAQARQAIAAQRLYGLASVETRQHLDPLPYATHLANLIVMDELQDAEKRGLSWREALRVLMPRGVLLVGGTTTEEVKARLAQQDLASQAEQIQSVGHWVRIQKAWPSDMGQWTHNRYRTSGNETVATDPIDPATQHLWIQWLDGEQDTWWGSHAAMAGIVAAEGRLISLADNEVGALIREGKYWRSLGRMSWILSCRDAFNGTVLWARPWSGWHQAKRKQTLAVADGRIYTVEAGRLTVTSIRDGSVLYTVDTPTDFDDQSWPHCEGDSVALHDAKKGGVWVFEAATGKLRWEFADAVAWVAVRDGRLFAAGGAIAGRFREAQRLVAFDLRSGKELWRKTGRDLGGDGDQIGLLCATHGNRVLAFTPKPETAVLKADSGEVLLKVPAQGDAFVTNEHLVFLNGDHFDLKSGEQVAKVPGRGGQWRGMGFWACAGGAFTERMFSNALQVFRAGGGKRATPSPEHPFIGSVQPHITCITGCAVAHGLVYQPEQGCGCAYNIGRMRGMYALSPADPVPPDKAFQEPGPLEPGPAYDKVEAAPDDPADWPIFRRDALRSCAGAGSTPDGLKVLWSRFLAVKPDGAVVRNSWRAQHLHNLTLSAPVAANGKVFVALVDEHAVAALSARDGAVLWRFAANARIDSPPAIHRGLCLFGCRDGWVYCLRAENGELVWRRRITPVDQRICVYGQLESRYPVVGSVLVDGAVAYATAGHSCQLGVMLWEFDPASGKTLAYRPTRRGRFTNDILVRDDDGSIYLDDKLVKSAKPDVPSPTPPQPKASRLGVPQPPSEPDHFHPRDTVILSTASSASMKTRGALYLRQITADRWAWRGNDLFGFCGKGKPSGPWPGEKSEAINVPLAFRLDASKLAEPASALVWQAQAARVWAMALSENRLLLAGPTPEVYEVPALAAENIPASPKAMPAGRPAEAMFDRSVLSELVRPWWPMQQDPLVAKGYVRVLDARTGATVAEIQLPAAPLQDALAVAGQRVYVCTADGAVVCLGNGIE